LRNTEIGETKIIGNIITIDFNFLNNLTLLVLRLRSSSDRRCNSRGDSRCSIGGNINIISNILRLFLSFTLTRRLFLLFLLLLFLLLFATMGYTI
jgi:hypothetical protein